MATTRLVQTILSGDDINKLDSLLKYYSKENVSLLIRVLIREEFDRLKLSTDSSEKTLT